MTPGRNAVTMALAFGLMFALGAVAVLIRRPELDSTAYVLAGSAAIVALAVEYLTRPGAGR